MRRMNSGTSSDRPSSRIEAKASLLEVNLHAHTAHMMLGINRILQRESHLDVIILCEDQIIRAHRLMLAAASGYFERVLDIVANASHQVPVILLPPSFEMFHVRKIIDFIYTGDVLIPEDKLQDFCDVVNFLEIRGIGGLMNSSTLIEGPEIVLESEDETVTEDLESSDELVQSPENRYSQKKRRVAQTSESEDSGNKMEVAEPERKVRKTAPAQTSTNRKGATPALHQDEGIEGDRSPVDSASQEEERPSPRMLPSCLRPDARTERVEGPIWAGSSSEGKRLYFCCQCSYVSTGKTNAVRHGRVHTGDKPYACSHCSQAFSRQDGLNTHVRRAHEPLCYSAIEDVLSMCRESFWRPRSTFGRLNLKEASDQLQNNVVKWGMSRMASNCDRFVDYFVVCGLDASSGLEVSPSFAGGDDEFAEELSPLERSYKCRILGHFPNAVAWNPYDPEAISTMCLPHGLEFRTQKHKLDPRFHGFVITREDGSRYYGFALTCYEEVRDSKICTALHTLQSMHIAESSRGEKKCPPPSPSLGNTKSLPRHFRLSPLADKTAGDAHKYYDIGKDNLFASKAIAVICQHPFVHMAKEFLCGLHRMVTRSSSSFAIEDYVYNVIFGVPLPMPGTSLGVRLWGPNSPLLCLQLPRADEELPLLEFPFRVVFSLLPPRPLVQFFTSALLEHQILLFSKDFNRLFLIAECVTALLFPFAWEHVYVPIVPASLMHFLDAPVPYIMGLQCSKKSRRGLDFTSQASLCVVDIDKGKVEVPEDTPCFPREDELIRDIQSVLAQFGLKEPYDKNRNEKLTSSFRRRKASWSNDSDSGLSSDRSSSPSRQIQRQNSSSSNVASVLASPRISGGSRIAAGWQRQKRRGTASADASEEEGDDGDDLYFGGIRDSEAFRKIEAALGNGPTLTTSAPTSTHIRDSQYVSDMKLNNGVREVFLDRFVRMFSSFENFVIQPNQDFEGWLSNRDSMQNFDKSTYLGDQPAQHRSFLSRFLETQMFTSFIDAKILESFGQRNPRVKFFCRRILKLRERLEDRGPSYEDSMMESLKLFDPRLKNAEALAALPSRLPGAVVRQGPLASFPTLDVAVLNKALLTSPLVTTQKKVATSLREKAASPTPASASSVEPASKRLSSLNDMSQAVIADKNWKFVEELLKEAKARTKRLLVEKLGAEAVALGHGGDASISGVEENTLIAALCDLLERIWSHGRQNKQGKSALWFHLHNYQQLEDPGQGIDPNQLTPDLSTLGLADAMKSSTGTLPRNGSGANLLAASSRSNSLARIASSLSGSSSSVRSPSVPPRMSRLERNASVERSGFSSRSRGPSPDLGTHSFRPMPQSLTFDMSHVQAMEEIKTEVGYARAWVRLALEKKLLSSHLRTLLSNYDLLRSYYKRYAFLRCDDEREQFLFHLLSLNAVDFFCFTNTYTKTVIPYQVLVVPSKRQSTTSANVWVSLTGTLGETKPIELPRGSSHVLFEHRNLGVLSSLTIGHDNSGMSPNWHVDHVLVRNEVTGHTYFFACGRWLGRAVDDGSTVRLLVGELLPSVNEDCGSSMSGSMFGSMSGGLSTSGSMTDSMYARASSSSGLASASSSRPQSPAVSRRFADSRLVGEIQGMLSDAVNILVKYFHKKESDRGSLTQLLCGEGGLLMAFERALLCGFKSSRLFSKNLYLWDYIVRVQAHYVATIQRERAEGKKQTDVNKYRLVKSYCILVDKINKAPAWDKDQKYKVSSSLGKDDKFQLFVCISVRDHLLSWFLDILAGASPTSQMYEEWSFMREPSLLSFLKRVLGALDEFDMSLETSVSKGILPSMYKCFQPPGVGNGTSNQAADPARGRERRRVVQR